MFEVPRKASRFSYLTNVFILGFNLYASLKMTSFNLVMQKVLLTNKIEPMFSATWWNSWICSWIIK